MFVDIVVEALTNSLNTITQIAVIVFPIMLVLRFARELNILNRVSSFFEPLTKRMYLSKEATFPLIVGTVFGLTYGAGVILQAAKEGRLTARDMFLTNVFLGLNHAIFEDTLVFAAIGANGWALLITRFFLAAIVTFFLGKWMETRDNRELLLKKLNA
ncbi:MAG: nucleoside recognition domain-containing protein [Bacillota bacterium]